MQLNRILNTSAKWKQKRWTLLPYYSNLVSKPLHIVPSPYIIVLVGIHCIVWNVVPFELRASTPNSRLRGGGRLRDALLGTVPKPKLNFSYGNVSRHSLQFNTSKKK